jgi:hypothetical protein
MEAASKKLTHNHFPSPDMSGYPSLRRLNDQRLAAVGRLSDAGCTPRQILSALRLEEQDLAAVSRTTYNAPAKIRREMLDGRTPIQALLDIITQNDLYSKNDLTSRAN